MKKLIWTLVILVVVGVFGGRAWYLHKQAEQNKDAVKVGLLSVNSGQYAQMGHDFNNGSILAIEELNAQSDKKMELIIEDGKAVAKEAINGFNKLLFHNVDAAIVIGDIQMPPVAPLVAEHKIPTVMTIMGNTAYLKHNQGRYMYQIWPANYGFCHTIGEYAKNELKLDKVAVIKMGSIYGQDGAKGFLDALGKPAVIVEEFKPDATTDLRPMVLKVLATNPDAIFVTGHGKAYSTVINHIKEYRFNGTLLTDSAINEIQHIENIKDIGGIIFAEIDDYDNLPAYIEFSKRYEKRFNKKPTLESVFGYDSVRLVYEGIKRNPKDIRAGLESIEEFDTMSGKMKLMEDGGSIFHLSIRQMQSDGTAKVIKE